MTLDGDKLLTTYQRTLAAVSIVATGCGGLGPEDLARIELSAGNGQIATVGTPVDVPPAVKAVDEKGQPIPGATVTFTVTSGGGSVESAEAMSGKDGIATIGGWTLGPITGENVLTASAPRAERDFVFVAVGLVGPPAVMEKTDGDAQISTAGRPVSTMPQLRVTDLGGNAIKNGEVVLEVGSGGGGGSIDETSTRTSDEGTATITGWTLGAAPGENTLIARAGDASTIFTATGVAGPVTLTIVAGDSQSTAVGTFVPIAPQVLVTDAQDLPVAGVDVAFEVVIGGGSVSSDTATTNAVGIVQVGWTLGTATGPNTMVAQIGDLDVSLFSATSVAGVPATLTISAGDQQFGAVGQQLPAPPAVLVKDSFENPVPGAEVTFTVTSGGGSVTGTPAISDDTGLSKLGTWTLGPAEGQNTLTAQVSGAASVVFTATGLGSVFDIEIVRLGDTASVMTQALENAVNRWQRFVVGDLPDVSFATNPADSAVCGPNPPFDDEIDDLRIFVFLEAIDGPGNVLATAGPCFVRDDGKLPAVGAMRFDTGDLDNLNAVGLLDDVILHEIGHVLGFGSLWGTFLVNPSLPDNEGADTHFSGPRAVAAFDAVGGTSFTAGSKVPVENSEGGAGTRDSHWRESVLGIENMTGFINAGANPLSAVSVESLGDIGYVVNAIAADRYSLSSAAPSGVAARGATAFRMIDDVWRGLVYVVERDGRITAVIRP